MPVPSTLKDVLRRRQLTHTHTECIRGQFDCSNRCSLVFYIDFIGMLSKELLQDEF